MAASCSSCPTATASSSPRDECYSEIYFRDEPPLGGLEAARAARPRATSATWSRFTSLSKRSNVPGMRSGFVAGDAAIIKQLPALPHLPRQRDEPGGAGGQHRGLERRGACGRQPRAVPRASSRRSRRCSRAVLDVALPDAGFYLWAGVPARGRRRRRLRPRPARSIQCDGAAGQPARARGARRQPRRAAASAWRWWPRPPNASKPRSASCNFIQTRPKPIHDPTAPADHRRRVGKPRQPLRQVSAPKEVRDAVEHVIADLNNGQLRVAERQGVGQWTVNQWIKKAVLLSLPPATTTS